MKHERLFVCVALASCGGMASPQVSRRSVADPVDAMVVPAASSAPAEYLAQKRARAPVRFAEELCEPWRGRRKLLAGITLSGPPVTYLQFRTGSALVDSAGWRCRDVTNPVACEHEFRAVARAAFATNPSQWLLVERQGHFTAVLPGPQLNALLAPIDTLADAVLVVTMAGYELRCNDGPTSTGEATKDGWRMTVGIWNQETSSDGRLGRPRHDTLVLEVSRDGRIEEVQTIENRQSW